MVLRRKYGITPGTHIAIEVDEDNRHARLTHAPRREADNQRTPLEGEAGFAFHGESEFSARRHCERNLRGNPLRTGNDIASQDQCNLIVG